MKKGTAEWHYWWLVTLSFDQCIKFVGQKWIGFTMFSTICILLHTTNNDTATTIMFRNEFENFIIVFVAFGHHMFHIMEIIWFDSSVSHLLLRLDIGYSMHLSFGFFCSKFVNCAHCSCTSTWYLSSVNILFMHNFDQCNCGHWTYEKPHLKLRK